MRGWIRARAGWIWIGCLAALLLGCASTPPSSFYTLTPLSSDAVDGKVPGPELSVGLGPVSFPVFLDRPQIVEREGGHRLTIDEFHRWGGTLQDDFLRVWSENLALLLGTSRILVFPSDIRYPLDFRVAAEVLAFEGTRGGDAVLKVRWFVLDPDLDRVLLVREDVYRRPWDSSTDPGASIAALSGALADFSRDVAAVLRTLPRPVEPVQDQAR